LLLLAKFKLLQLPGLLAQKHTQVYCRKANKTVLNSKMFQHLPLQLSTHQNTIHETLLAISRTQESRKLQNIIPTKDFHTQEVPVMFNC